MRLKLDRWNLAGLPGRTAERFIRALELVRDLLPPRIGAACLRTAWNGWCTQKRYQGIGACMFGCGSFWQEDSLEHYSGCRVCVEFLRRHLHFQGPIDRGHLIALGVHGSSFPRQEDLMRLALWAYVLYRCHNHLRYAGSRHHGSSDLGGSMEQYLREAISGHDGAISFVRNCWDTNFTYQAPQVRHGRSEACERSRVSPT